MVVKRGDGGFPGGATGAAEGKLQEKASPTGREIKTRNSQSENTSVGIKKKNIWAEKFTRHQLYERERKRLGHAN